MVHIVALMSITFFFKTDIHTLPFNQLIQYFLQISIVSMLNCVCIHYCVLCNNLLFYSNKPIQQNHSCKQYIDLIFFDNEIILFYNEKYILKKT